MSSTQRLAVWNGEREKTTGGLRKGDLIKNRHGRLVSKKKSEVARKLNNLGKYLAGTKKKAASSKDSKKNKGAAEKREEEKDDKVEKRKKKPAKSRRKATDAVSKMVQDPEVKAKRKRIRKRKSQVSPDVDVANIIPKIPKLEKKQPGRRSGRRKKKVNYSKMGGTLISLKDLEKAKKKPVPRRRPKKKVNTDLVLDTLHL